MSAVDDLIASDLAQASAAKVSPIDALIARDLQLPADQGFTGAGGGRGGQGGPTAAQNAERSYKSPISNFPLPMVRMSSALAPSYSSSAPDFRASVAGLGDTVGNVISGGVKSIDYAARRALGQSPQDATDLSNSGIGSLIENPVSKFINGASTILTGSNPHVEQSPSYQNEASQRLMQFISQNIGKGADWISQQTGVHPADVGNMINTLLVAAGPAASKTTRAVGGAIDTAKAWNSEINPTPRAPEAPTGPQLTPMQGGGAATSRTQLLPVLDGQDTSRGPFPQYKTTSKVGDAPVGEQQVRASLIADILGPNADGIRTGSLTGNEGTLRAEHTLAKNADGSPAAAVMAGQIAKEQQALSNFAQDRIRATGADPNLATPDLVGQRINDAFFGEGSLEDYFKQTKNAIYQQARDVAGNNPIATTHIDDLLNDRQFQGTIALRGHQGAVNGASMLIDLARRTGFNDPITREFLPPNSVAAWDAVRKSLNSNWSPDIASTIRDLNAAIDKDIAAAGGKELYALGENLHKVQKDLLDARGLGDIFGQVGKNNIKEGVPFDKIPDKLNKMPLDQWSHIDDVLSRLTNGNILGAPGGLPPVPNSVRSAAAQARAELHGLLAKEVYSAGAGKVGVWNQNSVNKVLNGPVGAKISSAFDPQELRHFQSLNAAGQFMPGVHSYEGAALQAQRLASQPGMVEKYAPAAARLAGHLAVPGLGEATGYGAEKLSGALAKSRGETDAMKLAKALRDNYQSAKK